MNIHQHDLSDDELDHVFRNAAENMDFDFETDSWTKMSQKLDAVNLLAPSENQAKNIWLKRSLSLLLVLLLMIGAYYLINSSSEQAKSRLQTKHKNSSENESNIGIKKDVATHKVDTDNLKNDISKPKLSLEKTINNSKSVSYEKEKIETKINVKKNKEISVNKKTLVSSKNQKNVIVENEKISNQTFTETRRFSKTKPKHDLTNTVVSETSLVARENNINAISGKEEIKNKKLNTNSEKNSIKISENNTIANQTATNQGIENISPPNSIITNIDEKIERWQLGNIKNITPKNSVFKANFNLPIIAFEAPKVEPTIPTSQSTSFKKGLNLRLGISPDFSIVTVDETARLGSNWAALLEYRFNNRFSLHAGVIRSTKYYNSYPESYEWPSNWAQPPALIDINASCKMLDIPLNVRYDITQKPNSRWFVSSGLTSYVMLNEKYTYNYENPSDPKIKWRNWQGKTGPYYFSVLNFSFGYEHQLFRRLSLQSRTILESFLSARLVLEK